MSVGKNFGWKISPAIPGNVRTFPGMQDRKTADAGENPLGPRGKTNVRCKKNFVGWKKNVGWKISPAIPGNIRTFPGMQDQKMAEAEKNPLGPRGKKLELSAGIFFIFVGWEKIVGWISPAIPGNVRTFSGMQDRKTADTEKTP